VIVNMKNTLPQNANHPVSSRPAFIEKPKHTIKKTFPEMPPFWICSVRRISCPQVGKRKNLSRYHKAGSRLRSLIKVQLTRRREDAQKLKAL